MSRWLKSMTEPWKKCRSTEVISKLQCTSNMKGNNIGRKVTNLKWSYHAHLQLTFLKNYRK